MLLSTYFDGNVSNAWKSVLGMCELFGNVAQFVGEKLGWEYNEKEGKAAYDFLEYVHQKRINDIYPNHEYKFYEILYMKIKQFGR